MSLYFSIFIFIITLFSCQSSFSTDDDSKEQANKMITTYFSPENESPSFVLYVEKMKKETKYISLNLAHETGCGGGVEWSFDLQEEVFGMLDSLFINLNRPDSTDVWTYSKGVSFEYYNKNRDLVFQLFSDSAVQYIDKDFIELKNNVILNTENHKTLMTNTLFWDKSNEMIWTYDPYVVQKVDSIEGEGCGLFSEDNFETYKTFNVQGVVLIE